MVLGAVGNGFVDIRDRVLGHAGALIAEMPYAEFQCMLDDPPGYRNYWSAEYLDMFPDEAVELFCARANDILVPSASQHVLFPQEHAVGRGPAIYPLPWRHIPWIVHPFGLWQDPADDERARHWARVSAPTSSRGRAAPSTLTPSERRVRIASSPASDKRTTRGSSKRRPNTTRRTSFESSHRAGMTSIGS